MSQFIEMFGGLCQDTPWSDVVTITNGKAYPEEYQEEGAYPICGSGGIMCYGEKKLCNGNTTILGRKGNINNPIFMESGYWIVDTAFSIDVDKAKLHPKFFYYWCCQYDFTKLNKQGVLPSLTRKDLEKVKMAIPQMRDQLKFVSIAEQADKSKFGDFKSQFIEMTGDPRTNPKGWTVKKLPELASYSIGLTYKPEQVSESGTIVLRSGNIQSYKIDLTDVVRVDCPIKESIYVQKDDILMCSRNGSAALVGKVAQIKEIHEPMTYGAFMTVIKSEYSDFLYLYFQSKEFREQVSTGKSSTMNQITQNMLDKISIPLPDGDTRKKLSDILHQADKSKSVIQKALVYLNDIQSDELGKIA